MQGGWISHRGQGALGGPSPDCGTRLKLVSRLARVLARGLLNCKNYPEREPRSMPHHGQLGFTRELRQSSMVTIAPSKVSQLHSQFEARRVRAGEHG